jgi:hypothetical protein
MQVITVSLALSVFMESSDTGSSTHDQKMGIVQPLHPMDKKGLSLAEAIPSSSPSFGEGQGAKVAGDINDYCVQFSSRYPALLSALPCTQR